MPVNVGNWWIFPLQGISGDEAAINFKQNVVIKTDGKDATGENQFIIYAGNAVMLVKDADTLPVLLAAL